MKTQTEKKILRHGDVVLHEIGRMALKGLKKIPGGTIARGTATGHSHALINATAATLYELPENKGRILVVKKRVGLKHQEHKTIMLAPGFYRVSIKRQYDQVLGQRPVMD